MAAVYFIQIIIFFFLNKKSKDSRRQSVELEDNFIIVDLIDVHDGIFNTITNNISDYAPHEIGDYSRGEFRIVISEVCGNLFVHLGINNNRNQINGLGDFSDLNQLLCRDSVRRHVEGKSFKFLVYVNSRLNRVGVQEELLRVAQWFFRVFEIDGIRSMAFVTTSNNNYNSHNHDRLPTEEEEEEFESTLQTIETYEYLSECVDSNEIPFAMLPRMAPRNNNRVFTTHRSSVKSLISRAVSRIDSFDLKSDQYQRLVRRITNDDLQPNGRKKTNNHNFKIIIRKDLDLRF